MSSDLTAPRRDVLTPTLLNRQARELIEGEFFSIWIEGELSNVSRPASGHVYFTLKDAGAQIRGALFKSRTFGLRFRPADGMQVLVRAKVSLYEARGEFQLIAEHIEEAGEGALRREFERLKQQLAAEGLFDPALKRPLPTWPRRIGVITSPSGAAIRDVLSVLSRRFPLVDIDVLPVPVQGREAPPAIVAMLRAANVAGRHDVLLLTRGGGSLEDLWAFNDESVARAIRASAIPVVAAIGHETDSSIAEFVADLRAATPSAAAELLAPERGALLHRLDAFARALANAQQRRLDGLSQRMDHLHGRLLMQHPQSRLSRLRERLDIVHRRLLQVTRRRLEQHVARVAQAGVRHAARSPLALIAQRRQRLALLRERIVATTRRNVDVCRARLAELARGLHAVSPLATLERGYAILVDDASDRVIRHVVDARTSTLLRARLVDGELALRPVDEPPQPSTTPSATRPRKPR